MIFEGDYELLYLPSDTNCSFKENKVSDFVTELHPSLQTQKNAKIYLTSILYPATFMNIYPGANVITLEEKRTLSPGYAPIRKRNIFIRPGHYDSIDQLIDQVNADLPPYIRFHAKNNRTVIEFKLKSVEQNAKIYLSDYLCGMLGFIHRKVFAYPGVVPAKLHVDEKITRADGSLNYRSDIYYDLLIYHHSLFIYTNIVHPVRIGDTISNLLATVHSERDAAQTSNSYIFKPISHPIGVPLALSDLQNIEIKICDSLGETYKFTHGKVLLQVIIK